MDSADRLIEYYFQRKISGMELSDINDSLEKQMLEEEERRLIVSQVEYKEMLYLKALKRKRQSRIALAAGLSLITVSIGLLAYTLLVSPFPYAPLAIYSLLSIGFISSVSGLIIGRM